MVREAIVFTISLPQDGYGLKSTYHHRCLTVGSLGVSKSSYVLLSAFPNDLTGKKLQPICNYFSNTYYYSSSKYGTLESLFDNER